MIEYVRPLKPIEVLKGANVTPNTSQATDTLLQQVIQADAVAQDVVINVSELLAGY